MLLLLVVVVAVEDETSLTTMLRTALATVRAQVQTWVTEQEKTKRSSGRLRLRFSRMGRSGRSVDTAWPNEHGYIEM